jgi:lipopolysaccharide export system ATP-binding protein
MNDPGSAGRVDQTGWLVAHGLGKSFGKKLVVRDVSIAVRRGEAVGLLGPNGAGKTTVFSMIMGLVKPDKGQIMLDGRPITRLPMFQRGRLGIGYLPQESSIFRGLSVKDNVLAILEGHVRSRAERKKRLDTLLSEFGISHLANTNALALSGGERRRLEIARAIAADPVFMLLDEPFAGVDPIAVAEVKALVRAADRAGHRRPDHRPFRARDAEPRRPGLPHPRRPGDDPGAPRDHHQRPRRQARLPRRDVLGLGIQRPAHTRIYHVWHGSCS